MKTNRCLHFSTTALTLAVLSIYSHAATAPVILPPTHASISIIVSDEEPASAGTAAPSIASAEWADIKDERYVSRAAFFAGLARLSARLDSQISALTAKQAADGTLNGDFAILQMHNARSQFKFAGEELGKATPETWNQVKAKVGQAWAKTQKSYSLGILIATR